MKRTLLLILAVFWTGAFLQVAQAASCTMPSNATTLMSQIGAILNATREDNRRSTLTRNAALDQAAQTHACDMGTKGFFAHQGSDGSNLGTRVKRTGYCYRKAVENVAMGPMDAAGVMTLWMNSSGHRKNILLKRARDYGLGVAQGGGQPYFVMVLAEPSDKIPPLCR